MASKLHLTIVDSRIWLPIIMKNLKGLISVFGLVAVFALAASAQTVLTSIDGNRVDIDGQNGKVVILAVGASWLPLSAKQAEYTNAIAKKYAGSNVAVYFVATDSMTPGTKNYASDQVLREFVGKSKLAVPVLRDPGAAAIGKKLTFDQLPAFVIIDKNGVQSGKAFGGIDPKYDVTVPISKTVDGLL